jgi:hypothetical protein
MHVLRDQWGQEVSAKSMLPSSKRRLIGSRFNKSRQSPRDHNRRLLQQNRHIASFAALQHIRSLTVQSGHWPELGLERSVANGRVEERRGGLGHSATLRFLSPLIGRVEDWRAGVGRCLYSLLSRPFVCECHTISTMPRFQPPPRRTQHADFLALRSPVCFASRLIRSTLLR